MSSLILHGLNCSERTVSVYVARYPRLREALDDIYRKNLDIAEASLLEAIRNGNMTAVIFYLKTKGKQRGYVERAEVTGKEGGPVQVESKLDLSLLSDADLEIAELIVSKAEGSAARPERGPNGTRETEPS